MTIMRKKELDDLDLEGKTVLLRADLNVPIQNGQIGDDSRILAVLPTLQKLLKSNVRVVLISHLGRPKGRPTSQYSLQPIVVHLQKLLGRPVGFCTNCVGDEALAAVKALAIGGVLLLENVRFHTGEEENNPDFARQLAKLGDVYVNDAFGAAHRAHASVSACVHFFKQAAWGLLMKKEVSFLGNMLQERRKKPRVAIIGGAKVSDKIGVLRALLQKVETIMIGGAMAYTFLQAQGRMVGASFVQPELLTLANELLEEAPKAGGSIVLPVDHIIAQSATKDALVKTCQSVDIPKGWMGLDIGPITLQVYINIIERAKIVLWNGPLGMFEIPAFAKGTLNLAKALAKGKGLSVVGGGNSIEAVQIAGVADQMAHVSTGGGAMLEFLEGKPMPGLDALPDTA